MIVLLGMKGKDQSLVGTKREKNNSRGGNPQVCQWQKKVQGKVHCWMEEKIQFIISRVEKTEVQKAFSVSLFRSPDCSRPLGVLTAWQGEGQPGMRKEQTRTIQENSIKST